MKNYLKILTLIVLTVGTLAMVGCGSDEKDVKETPKAEQEKIADSTGTMTKEEYAAFLQEKYNYYLNNPENEAQYDVYNIYDEQFSYMGTYDEFITGYNQFAGEERAKLEAFKKELETNVPKGNPEVDAINADVITALDEALLASDDYGKDFETKAKDYGTYTKDQVIKGLRDLGRVPYEARKGVENLVEDVKNRLQIKD